MELDFKRIEELLLEHFKNVFYSNENLNIKLNNKIILKGTFDIKFNETWNEDFDEEQISLEILNQTLSCIDNYFFVYNLKSLCKILNFNCEVFLENKTQLILKSNDKIKKIDILTDLKCFKNNKTKEIVDVITAYNRNKTKISKGIYDSILNYAKQNKEYDYLKALSKEISIIDNSEIKKYINILLNKIILEFNINLNTVNNNLLNRKFYFKHFINNTISNNKLDIAMIHGLTKNFTIIKKSKFLEDKKYFNDDAIRKTESLINEYLDFLENKISEKYNIKAKVNSCNIINKTINITYLKDDVVICKDINY